MTHVSILVPHSSVLPSSVVGLFKIFDLANRYSAEECRGAAFELHLVGSASAVQLYGGQFLLKPDLTLPAVAATDFAIIPAMAGNIAQVIEKDSAFIPWIEKHYLAGSEIAGLCTGAFFILETSLIHEGYCSPHWFVDATFRKEYSQINSLAEKAASSAESIHSDSGAWSYLQKLVEDVAGKRAALACSASFQDPFNHQCQSILSISDRRRQHANPLTQKDRAEVEANSTQERTVEQLLSLFEVNPSDREGSVNMDTLVEESLQTPVWNANPRACCAFSDYQEHGRAGNHNTKTFKALFKKIERLETR